MIVAESPCVREWRYSICDRDWSSPSCRCYSPRHLGAVEALTEDYALAPPMLPSNP